MIKSEQKSDSSLTGYRVPETELMSTQFRAEWEDLLEQSHSLYRQYCSPEWIEAAMLSGFSSYCVFAVRNHEGTLSGLCICTERGMTVRFGPRRLGLWLNRPVLSIEGDILLRQPVEQKVVSVLLSLFPPRRIVHLKYLPVTHPASEILSPAKAVSKRHFRWILGHVHSLPYRAMPRSVHDYEMGLSSKKRWHLKRRARQMANLKRAPLSLDRITSPAQIEDFLTMAGDIIGKSWQRNIPIADSYKALDNSAFLRLLSGRGMLRAYVLRAGNHPCAFVLGYQCRNVYHYADAAYDESLAQASPGLVLLHYMMRDLISWQSPHYLNFGIGDAEYKRRFSDSQVAYHAVMFLPKTLGSLPLLTIGRFFDMIRGSWAPKTKSIFRKLGACTAALC